MLTLRAQHVMMNLDRSTHRQAVASQAKDRTGEDASIYAYQIDGEKYEYSFPLTQTKVYHETQTTGGLFVNDLLQQPLSTLSTLERNLSTIQVEIAKLEQQLEVRHEFAAACPNVAWPLSTNNSKYGRSVKELDQELSDLQAKRSTMVETIVGWMNGAIAIDSVELLSDDAMDVDGSGGVGPSKGKAKWEPAIIVAKKSKKGAAKKGAAKKEPKTEPFVVDDSSSESDPDSEYKPSRSGSKGREEASGDTNDDTMAVESDKDDAKARRKAKKGKAKARDSDDDEESSDPSKQGSDEEDSSETTDEDSSDESGDESPTSPADDAPAEQPGPSSKGGSAKQEKKAQPKPKPKPQPKPMPARRDEASDMEVDANANDQLDHDSIIKTASELTIGDTGEQTI